MDQSEGVRSARLERRNECVVSGTGCGRYDHDTDFRD